MSLDAWVTLNQGIETGGGDVPIIVQRKIYDVISSRFIRELQLAGPDNHGLADMQIEGIECMDPDDAFLSPAEGVKFRGGMGLATEKSLYENGITALSACALLEGWVKIPGARFPFPSKARSEVISSSRQSDVSNFGDSCVEEAVSVQGLHLEQRDDLMWASLCCFFLFLSGGSAAGDAGVPYALIDMRRIHIEDEDVADDPRVLRFTGQLVGNGDHFPVLVVVLLPDGRWREVDVPQVDLEFSSDTDAHCWREALMGWSPMARPVDV